MRPSLQWALSSASPYSEEAPYHVRRNGGQIGPRILQNIPHSFRGLCLTSYVLEATAVRSRAGDAPTTGFPSLGGFRRREKYKILGFCGPVGDLLRLYG